MEAVARDGPASLAGAPPAGVVPDVPLLAWPAEETRRRELAAAGQPRLLLVAPDGPVPEQWDVLEDWVRAPADVGEVLARQATLRSRVRPPAPRPELDEHGLLWLGERWVAIPPSQLAVASLLVARPGRLVAAAELREAYVAGGGAGDAAALKAVLLRLGRRVAAVGLQLHAIRGRGAMLEVAAAERDATAS